MSETVRKVLDDRNDLRAEIAREIVQQVAQLQSGIPDEETVLDVMPNELEAIVRRVLAQFGVR